MSAINTCNGDDCTASYAPTHAQQFPREPLAWTEIVGWLKQWDSQPNSPFFDNRTRQDVAFVIAEVNVHAECVLPFHKHERRVGGAHHNYCLFILSSLVRPQLIRFTYMWLGGNHVGCWLGSSRINMYADSIPTSPRTRTWSRRTKS